jgi:phage terminase small subunit
LKNIPGLAITEGKTWSATDMPKLQNPRHEAFAAALAEGASQDEAYEDAGFSPGNGHASRLAGLLGVAERVAELRAEQPDLSGATPQAVILALLKMAERLEDARAPAEVRERRLTLLAIGRLQAELAASRAVRRRASALGLG